MHFKIKAIAVDRSGNEQEVELLVDDGSVEIKHAEDGARTVYVDTDGAPMTCKFTLPSGSRFKA